MSERVHDAVFWRATAALCLVLATSSFMNISAFPLFDHVFTYARDISVLANAACLVAVALVASFRSSSLDSRVVNIVAIAILAVGSSGIAASFALQSPWLLVVSSCAVSAARGWVSVVVGVSLSRFSIPVIAQIVTLAFLGNWRLAIWPGFFPQASGCLRSSRPPSLHYCLRIVLRSPCLLRFGLPIPRPISPLRSLRRFWRSAPSCSSVCSSFAWRLGSRFVLAK